MNGNRDVNQQMMVEPTNESTIGVDLSDRWRVPRGMPARAPGPEPDSRVYWNLLNFEVLK
jgi:hypothetical protein